MKTSKNMQAGSIVKELAEIFESIVECVDVPMRTKKGGSVRMTLSEIVERQERLKKAERKKQAKNEESEKLAKRKEAAIEISKEFADDLDENGLPYDEFEPNARKLYEKQLIFASTISKFYPEIFLES